VTGLLAHGGVSPIALLAVFAAAPVGGILAAVIGLTLRVVARPLAPRGFRGWGTLWFFCTMGTIALVVRACGGI